MYYKDVSRVSKRAEMEFISNGTNLEPVIPAQRETQSRVDEAVGVSSESGRHWQPSGHFTQSTHDQVAQKADDGVANQQGSWTSILKRSTTAEKTCQHSLLNKACLPTEIKLQRRGEAR